MPHYKDGTEAKRGDIVKGKGYNIKDENGDLKEVVGVIVSVTEGVEQCNVSLLIPNDSMGYFVSAPHLGSNYGYVLVGTLEYGQADHFELVI